MRVGAHYLGGQRCEFRVWAPAWGQVEVLLGEDRRLPLARSAGGYWETEAEAVAPGTRYTFRLGGRLIRPDPASHLQPEGVHRPSQVVDHAAFPWRDQAWPGREVGDMVLYELHAGVFTPTGTLPAVVDRLDDLHELGVNTLEIMPVAAFPGDRNWGYDGVYPFAVHQAYGGPEGLKTLVNACHERGLAVVLDVVYNHLGPEGNYLRDFGPYFTPKYRTPWGESLNFDDADSDEVRNFFLENALFWFRHYHVDALRLDAIHAICDFSARPFLAELSEAARAYSRQAGRRHALIAESDLNDARVLRPESAGGMELDAAWCDDFHHALHTLLTAENDGYYRDFGRVEDLAKSWREGYVYSGQYSPYRRRRHGNSSADRPARQLVVFSQNHDQVGNRMLGERLASLASWEAVKLAAAAVLLSPYVPLLFMGEEYAETAPFLYFTDHGDPELNEAVRRGRREEFKAFRDRGEPPDPARADTFSASKLRWERRLSGSGARLRDFYRELLRLRREWAGPASGRPEVHCDEAQKVLHVFLHGPGGLGALLCNFHPERVPRDVSLPAGEWRKLLDSADNRWNGPGSRLPERAGSSEPLPLAPLSLALYART